MWATSTGLPKMGLKSVTHMWHMWRVTRPIASCDTTPLCWGCVNFGWILKTVEFQHACEAKSREKKTGKKLLNVIWLNFNLTRWREIQMVEIVKFWCSSCWILMFLFMYVSCVTCYQKPLIPAPLPNNNYTTQLIFQSCIAGNFFTLVQLYPPPLNLKCHDQQPTPYSPWATDKVDLNS